MHPKREKVATVDEYIKLFPDQVQERLRAVRKIIQETAPQAKESISYSIPAYNYHRWLVYFSAYAKHLSLSFPPHKLFEEFQKDLSGYKTSRSTVQLPYDQPLPINLIKRMVAYKMQENIDLEAEKIAQKS